LVDLIGIEPMTSSMPWKRAPSCATGPHVEALNFFIFAVPGDFVKLALWREHFGVLAVSKPLVRLRTATRRRGLFRVQDEGVSGCRSAGCGERFAAM
jgi:hypothetical protein